MAKETIKNFSKWREVVDYESDERSVTLLNSKGECIGEFDYPKFTQEDFEFFKSFNF